MKEVNWQELKINDKIYSISYLGDHRTIQGLQVTKVNEKSLRMKRILVEGLGNTIGSEDVYIKYRPNRRAWYHSLNSAIDCAISANGRQIVRLHLELKNIPKQIKGCEKEILELKSKRAVNDRENKKEETR